ncbi:hypothetical protein NG895_10045 [Aeoliella sp. ICT_H6.2]|uniref:Uncharacterized protein n=1 Tax=Aeoliella straminimaris TaxID=2954799 RepID=A0A9X2JGC7_9BACT|nr:hypothetical protein [Aeoliella straminimaris]MCO6044247.1 hypothetical protein [Aeoliella straminimaris]
MVSCAPIFNALAFPQLRGVSLRGSDHGKFSSDASSSGCYILGKWTHWQTCSAGCDDGAVGRHRVRLGWWGEHDNRINPRSVRMVNNFGDPIGIINKHLLQLTAGDTPDMYRLALIGWIILA